MDKHTTLDTLVATAGMGWPVIDIFNTSIPTDGNYVDASSQEAMTREPNDGCACRFQPSTNIAHALDALEEVVGTGYYQLDNGWHDDGKGGRTGGHTCTITLGTGTYKGTAASPAMAISLACVRACGVPEENIKEAMDGK